VSARDRGHLEAGASLALPRAAILGTGRLRTLLSASGSGGTWYDDHALTRWRPEPLGNRYGWWFQVRDADSGRCHPIGRNGAAETQGVVATDESPGRFAILHDEDGIEARVDVCHLSEGAGEIRRVTLRNAGNRRRTIELATALEVSLQHPAADAAHPAFSKLFVQTEYAAGHRALIARRRPRGDDEKHPWMVLAAPGADLLEWETDRATLIGRGDEAHARARMHAPGRFTGTTGNVLDPVFAFRRRVVLPPGGSTALDFVLAAASDRESALATANEVREPGRVTLEFQSAEKRERTRLGGLGLDTQRAVLLQSLAAAALEGRPLLRAGAGALGRAAGPAGRLAETGIDPAASLVTVRMPSPGGTLSDALEALRYWRALGLPFQVLVIADDLSAAGVPTADPGAGVFVVPFDALGAAGVDLALAMACWAPAAPLDARIQEPAAASGAPDALPEAATADGAPRPAGAAEHVTLRFDNGIGGFSEDGAEYVIRIRGGGAGGRPPLPWINVIANERMGFFVSESGAASTWGCNSREYRLTPWSNDPLLDPHSEALYIRDDESGAFWSPLPGPVPIERACEVRHGLGVSRFLTEYESLEHETQWFVAREDPVRFCRVRLVNRSPRTRRLSLYAFQQLVLGALPETSGRFVITSRDQESGALFATSAVGDAFAGRVAFASVVGGDVPSDVSADRAGFLGAAGDARRPDAVARGGALDGVTGPGLDPCFAQRMTIEIGPGEEIERTFVLGDAADAGEARILLARYRPPGRVEAEFGRATEFWRDLVGGLQIETPEPAIDLMVNRWLPYQSLSGRILGRTAFYQSSGAYGFRDQLQDASAFAMLDPDRMRRQILIHAAHQFVEGDVLHWWHPPLDRGMRTRFADDLLWLPYLAAGYVRATGDAAVLEERTPYLTARPLAPGEAEAFVEPRDAGSDGTVYEHACRAIDRSLGTGAHGLPLFGSGDWNDGMNRVGHEGRGESVWMGFFLISVIGAFAPLCEQRGDAARAARYRAHAVALGNAIERHAWDGSWYLLAFDDDGHPLGTHADDECRIDGLVQAWSVISGAAPAARTSVALDAMETHLISETDGIARLLTPPFENTPRDPGYIKGYVTGVRENGGQYTHAALWMVQALAESGRRDRAARVLSMLSPVNHARDATEVARYQVEPYVVAADVYGAAPHVGRGGWTWYTGSASWMYRVAVESVLGLEWQDGETLLMRSRMPDEWPSCTVRWRVPGSRTHYRIEMRRSEPGAMSAATVDGQSVTILEGTAQIPLVRDDREHRVTIQFGTVSTNGAAADGLGRRTTIEHPATARGGPGGSFA
jgi:cyclic beta-1,2-glucan synthetase